MRSQYRDWWINYDPPPIPIRSCDWQYWHDDYDGAPDAYDHRHGSAASEEECKQRIDEWYADNACSEPEEEDKS